MPPFIQNLLALPAKTKAILGVSFVAILAIAFIMLKIATAPQYALIASGRTSPQIFLLDNNTKPPYSNQWNVGVRQAVGDWFGSLSYNGVRGYRGFTWDSASVSYARSLLGLPPAKSARR